MSDTPFDRALAHTVGIEGGFSNHPSDSGGKTRFGITEALARRYGYVGDMRVLPIELARDIYRKEFWEGMSCDAVALFSEELAAELFDTGVNCGPGTAVRFLQVALNSLNRRGEDYADIAEDGVIGSGTLGALRAYFDFRRGPAGEIVLLRALNALQGHYYIDLSRRREKDEDFVYGWLRTRVEI